jgi:hypothetical protein
MEMLLKEIKAGQEQMVTKLDADRKTDQAKMDADSKKTQEDFMAKLNADRKTGKEDFMARMDANMKAWREKTDADMKAWGEEIHSMWFDTTNTRTETMVCQEIKAHPEEEKPASVDMKPEAEEQQEEVPVEDATVIPFGEPEEETTSITRNEIMACQQMEERLEEVDWKPEVAKQREVPVEDAIVKPVNGRKKRHRGNKRAAGRRGEPKKLTQGDCGSRMQSAAACRKVPRRATVARRRRDAFKNERTQDGCQRRLAAACRGTSHCAEVVRKMKANKKTAVARQWHDA